MKTKSSPNKKKHFNLTKEIVVGSKDSRSKSSKPSKPNSKSSHELKTPGHNAQYLAGPQRIEIEEPERIVDVANDIVEILEPDVIPVPQGIPGSRKKKNDERNKHPWADDLSLPSNLTMDARGHMKTEGIVIDVEDEEEIVVIDRNRTKAQSKEQHSDISVVKVNVKNPEKLKWQKDDIMGECPIGPIKMGPNGCPYVDTESGSQMQKKEHKSGSEMQKKKYLAKTKKKQTPGGNAGGESGPSRHSSHSIERSSTKEQKDATMSEVEKELLQSQEALGKKMEGVSRGFNSEPDIVDLSSDEDDILGVNRDTQDYSKVDYAYKGKRDNGKSCGNISIPSESSSIELEGVDPLVFSGWSTQEDYKSLAISLLQEDGLVLSSGMSSEDVIIKNVDNTVLEKQTFDGEDIIIEDVPPPCPPPCSSTIPDVKASKEPNSTHDDFEVSLDSEDKLKVIDGYDTPEDSFIEEDSISGVPPLAPLVKFHVDPSITPTEEKLLMFPPTPNMSLGASPSPVNSQISEDSQNDMGRGRRQRKPTAVMALSKEQEKEEELEEAKAAKSPKKRIKVTPSTSDTEPPSNTEAKKITSTEENLLIFSPTANLSLGALPPSMNKQFGLNLPIENLADNEEDLNNLDDIDNRNEDIMAHSTVTLQHDRSIDDTCPIIPQLQAIKQTLGPFSEEDDLDVYFTSIICDDQFKDFLCTFVQFSQKKLDKLDSDSLMFGDHIVRELQTQFQDTLQLNDALKQIYQENKDANMEMWTEKFKEKFEGLEFSGYDIDLAIMIMILNGIDEIVAT